MPVLYHIGEHQIALPEVTATPRSYEHNKGGVVRAGGDRASNTSTRSHARRWTTTLPLFTLDSPCLCFYLVFSDSNTCQQRSAGHDLSLTTTRNKKIDGEPWGRTAVLFCWCRLSERSFCTGGTSLCFTHRDESAVYTRRLKHISLSCDFPFFPSWRGFSECLLWQDSA